MKTTRSSFAALMFIAIGCASPNVNPPAPRANTGYVDLYSSTDAELCWDVKSAAGSHGDFKTVFRDVEPAQGDVLRLAFAPGRHRLRITFLNRVVTKPAEAEIEVENGRITPVRITLTEHGSTFVESKEISRGNTFYGRAGRRTKINSEETVMYDLSAVADTPIAYRAKEQMPYAQ